MHRKKTAQIGVREKKTKPKKSETYIFQNCRHSVRGAVIFVIITIAPLRLSKFSSLAPITTTTL
jgi:hypothetical protein